MSNQIPKAEWAIEKVRIYAPERIDKITLMAIAGYMRYDTGMSICTKGQLARDLGRSPKMVQMHLRSLITGMSRGYRDPRSGQWIESKPLPGGSLLIADKPSQYEHRPSKYYIPCVSLTTEELEFIVGMSGDQLNLGLIAADEPGNLFLGNGTLKSVTERQWEKTVTAMGEHCSDNGGTMLPPPIGVHGLKIDPSKIFAGNGEMALQKKVKKTDIRYATPDMGADGKVIIAQETEDLISGVLTKLAAGAGNAPVGLGSRLRERFDSQFGPADDRPV